MTTSAPEQTERQTADRENRTAIYKTLARHGIVRLEARYEGSSDSGCIDEPVAYDADDAVVPIPDKKITITLCHDVWDEAGQKRSIRLESKTTSLCQAIRQWCYDVLEQAFPGWEIDHGSVGVITIDVRKQRGHINHDYFDLVSHKSSF